MELFDPRVRSHSGLNNLSLLEHSQAGLDITHLSKVLFFVARVGSLDLDGIHTTEEYLED